MDIQAQVANIYVEMICRYVNEVRSSGSTIPPTSPPSGKTAGEERGRSGKDQVGKSPTKGRKGEEKGKGKEPRSRSPTKCKNTNEHRQRLPIGISSPVQAAPRLSCAMIPPAEFIKIEKATTDNTMTTEIDKSLTNHNLQRDKLMSLDYLFISYFWDDKSHWLLLGIAPKQRFVFALDCHYPFKTTERPLKPFLAFCLRALPENTDWPVYGEWSNRSQTSDGSPDAPQQRDSYNCGVFMIMNAFCLAFGYNCCVINRRI
jgi:hypothetical protein